MILSIVTNPRYQQRYIYLGSLVVFIILLFITPYDFIPQDLGGTILTVITFLFGFISGFYIVVTTTDYNAIKLLLAEETATWIILYYHVKTYVPRRTAHFSRLVDAFMRRAFDVEVIDYTRITEGEFSNITTFINTLSFSSNRSNDYDNIRDSFAELIKLRQKLTVLGARALTMFQWVILFVLATLVIVSLYGLRTGELFFEIITVLVSSSIVLILLLIRDLDLYVWNENTFSFEIFQNVFRAIGQLPYYPEESLRDGRVSPADPRYRIGKLITVNNQKKRKAILHSSHH